MKQCRRKKAITLRVQRPLPKSKRLLQQMYVLHGLAQLGVPLELWLAYSGCIMSM